MCHAALRAALRAAAVIAALLPAGAADDVCPAGDAACAAGARFVNTTTEAYPLNDGTIIPTIGFGTYRIPPGDAAYRAVRAALEAGYRMIDTAQIYGNEADVGRAVRDSGIPRSEIFVCTKVFNQDHGYDRALAAGRGNNERLGLGYIDLLLIHSPYGSPDPNAGKIVETYDALLQLRKEGVTRSVGVSNFAVEHLQALADYCRPAPAVNQIELHPLVFNERRALVEYCKAHGIIVQPYGSVLSGHLDLLALAESIAKAHERTPAQVMLRWALDQGFQVIPKTTHEERMRENFAVLDFALTEIEHQELNALKGSLGEYWNPLTVPVDVGDVGPRPASC